jgi:hypothetical protein
MEFNLTQPQKTTAIQSIRRNHALEHATIHLLSRKHPQTQIIGRSDRRGFYLYGELPTDEIYSTAQEALERLRSGEHRLAIHPNCGTNLVTAALLAGLASFASLSGASKEDWRARIERLPLAIFMTTLALIIAQPLGRSAQKHLTTDSDPGRLEIIGIRKVSSFGGTTHRVFTTQ